MKNKPFDKMTEKKLFQRHRCNKKSDNERIKIMKRGTKEDGVI